LPKQDDISSTERLLNVIRNTGPVKEPLFSSPPPSKRTFLPSFKTVLGKSVSSVGVDITDEHIRLLKIIARGNRPAVLNHLSIPLSPSVAKDRSQISGLLRSHLPNFCGASPLPVVWTALPHDQIDIRRIRIPRLSGSQLENAVYWTVQKEAPFDKDQTILDFHSLGEVIDSGVSKTEVLVCTAPRNSVEDLEALFKDAGFALAGIIAPAFAFENFFKTGWIETGDSPVCSLLIDFNWSRIDIFRPGGELIASRAIKAGITSMVESIKNEALQAGGGLSLGDTPNEGGVLDLPVFESSEADQAFEILNVDGPDSSAAVAGLLKEGEVFEMVLPALERLIRQVERTLEHVSLRFSDAPVGKMYISGPITAYPSLANHIGSQLGMPHSAVEPFASVGGDLEIPKPAVDRAAYVSSLGLALSTVKRTPNFLLTYRETGLKLQKARFNQAIAALFLLGAAILFGIHHFQLRHIEDLEVQISRLSPVADSKAAESDREALLSLAGRINTANETRKVYAVKCLPAALIAEITTLAPEEIRFIRVEGGDLSDEEKSVAVDAVVYGPRGSMETRLAGYLMSLNRSPLFAQIALKKQNYERLGSRDVLRFTLDLKGV